MCPICTKPHDPKELCPYWKDEGQDRYAPDWEPIRVADSYERVRYKMMEVER